MKKNIISLGFTLSVFLVFLSCTTTSTSNQNPEEAASARNVSDIRLLVKTEWLKENINNSELRIIDYGRKNEDYQKGHIPGAVFVDRKTVWNEMNGISGMLPLVETVIEAVEKAGVSNNNSVIIYDDVGGLWASRLFWALEFLGHKDVHVLNGGWSQWDKEGHPAQTETPVVSKGDFVVQVQSRLLANKAWILEYLKNPGIQIIDSRSPKEYIGKDVRSAHGGHIPGAVNLNWINNLAQGDSKTFLPEEALADIYESRKISKNKQVVTYCQTGVRGAHTYFVLRLLGYPSVRVYDGSWAEWGNDQETPKMVGLESPPN